MTLAAGLFAVTTALVALISSAYAWTGTGFSCNNQADNSWINYTTFNTTASWNNVAKQIAVLTRTPWLPSVIFYHNNVTNGYFGTNFLFKSSWANGTAAIYDAVGTLNGQLYFGEVGTPDKGIMIEPAEPKLLANPISGERWQIEHQVADSSTGPIRFYPMHTTFQTIAHYVRWGIWNDVWRTTLVEYFPTGSIHPEAFHDPDTNRYISYAYNYCFANGIGLVDFWYGPVDSNGNIKGAEFYAIAWTMQ
jgi:hypothetical protein